MITRQVHVVGRVEQIDVTALSACLRLCDDTAAVDVVCWEALDHDVR